MLVRQHQQAQLLFMYYQDSEIDLRFRAYSLVANSEQSNESVTTTSKTWALCILDSDIYIGISYTRRKSRKEVGEGPGIQGMKHKFPQIYLPRLGK